MWEVWLGITQTCSILEVGIMKMRKIKLRCPLCPGRAYDHIYTTYHGFYRHIFADHTVDKYGKPLFSRDLSERSNTKIAYLRLYYIKYSKHKDIPVNGKAHVEALIEAMVKKGFNPTLREVGI